MSRLSRHVHIPHDILCRLLRQRAPTALIQSRRTWYQCRQELSKEKGRKEEKEVSQEQVIRCNGKIDGLPQDYPCQQNLDCMLGPFHPSPPCHGRCCLAVRLVPPRHHESFRPSQYFQCQETVWNVTLHFVMSVLTQDCCMQPDANDGGVPVFSCASNDRNR